MSLTKSPLGSLMDKSLEVLQLYKYGRKPFIFFASGILLTLLGLQYLQQTTFVRGINPPNPEWKESLSQLHTRIQHLYRSLIFCGSFVLGISQAVKKQKDIYNPDLGPVFLYGKLLLLLVVIEFVCNLVLQPTKSNLKLSSNPFFLWARSIAKDTSEQMISGASSGFGYGYLVRGAGVLFKAY
jgi:hypothetical protein